MSATIKERQLSPFEASFAWRHDLNIYLACMVGATLKNPDSKTLTPEDVYGALKPMLVKNTVLSSVLRLEEGRYKIILPEQIDLSNNVVFRKPEDTKDIQRLIEKRISTKLEGVLEDTPGWRLWITPNDGSYLIHFFFHHSFVDGTSSKNFILEFVKNLNAGHGKSDSIFTISESASLLPSLESLLGLDLPFTGTIKGYDAPVDSNISFWSGTRVLDVTNVGPHYTQSIYKTISTEEMEILAARAKKHGASVSTILTATALYSLQCSIPKTFPKGLATLPRNLRPWINKNNELGQDPFGVYISSIPVESAATSISELWESAKSMKSVIHTYNTRGISDTHNDFIPLAGDIESLYKERVGGLRTYTLELSYLYVNDLPFGQHEWHLSDLTFAQGMSSEGPPIYCNAISHHNGPLTISFVWATETVGDDETMLNMTETFEKTIKTLLK